MGYSSRMNQFDELNDLAGASLNLFFGDRRGIKPDELERIDALTPFYRKRIDELPAQQRKIVATFARVRKPLRIKELTIETRLEQQNKVSAQVCRLVKAGFLAKRDDGRYYLNPEYPDLERYLVIRNGEFAGTWRSDRSKELISDRENPISYFIAHRDEIREKIC